MAKLVGKISGAVGGIADSPKLGPTNSVAFERALDFRTDPTQFTVNPRAERQAGNLVKDLPMWADLACSNLYFYGNTGTIYKKDLANTWTIDHIAPESQGNGLVFFPEDGYLYYTQDKTIGRKSDACSTSGVYYDAFLESEGGEPTNTKSILFVKASSQYAYSADNAGNSITDDISMEAYLKFTSLPATDEIQVIISKWKEQGNQRSYKFDLTTKSNYFGDGRDGALTISTNTTEDPVDANCTGTSGEQTLTITNAHASFSSLASGDKVLIHQTRGTGAGNKQIATVSSYSAGVLTIQEPLTFSPAHSATATDANKAQIRLLKQHTNVTVNAGITYTCKAWDGLKGGILGWFANGTTTINGSLTAKGKGFRGGVGYQDGILGDLQHLTLTIGYTAEGTGGAAAKASNYVYTANGNGAGASSNGTDALHNCAGSGGGNATAGTTGEQFTSNGQAGNPGILVYDDNLVQAGLGGGGAGGTTHGLGSPSWNQPRDGANGGGYIEIDSATITMGAAGSINVNGNDGTGGAYGLNDACGGGGAGGCIALTAEVATLGTALITASGGSGGEKVGDRTNGGAGANGRNRLTYATSYTGTTTPTLVAIQDTTLGASDGYVLRLQISNNGTAYETYTQDVTDIIDTTNWNRWAVTWDAPTSTANFYRNGVLLSTQTGAMTQIYNSTANLALAASYDSSGNPENYLDALMDDTRLWNSVRDASLLVLYNNRVLTGVETNLCAYYEFEDDLTDSQTYTFASDMTGVNTPTYSADVPFSGITTRADQDVLIDESGNTYSLTTAINEGATHRQTFTPTKEPVKSVMLNINQVGTGNWTVVVHDALNREQATLTVANAQLHTGYYEFIFASSFRPILTANYHIHVYSSVADGKIVSSSSNDMETAYFADFYQILVDDQYHPMIQFLNFVAVGNERYVGKLEAGNIYNPHQLVLPAGYRVRCFALWNDYLAIGVWKGTSITDTDQGKIFLWDGSSDVSNTSSPNTIIDCLEGGVNAMKGAGGILSVIAGYKGKFMNYGGVNESSYYSGGQLQKVTQLPQLQAQEYAEVAPGAMCMWRSVMHFGACLNTNSSSVHPGIYSYGTLNANYPVSLGYDYPLSIGDTTSSEARVGCIFPQGTNLYMGWQNGNGYGIDKISIDNVPYDSATIELLITDFGRIYQEKPNLVLRAECLPLKTGQSLTFKFKPNRNSSWLTIGTQNTLGATDITMPLSHESKEAQYALDLVTNGQQLTVTTISVEIEDAAERLGIS